MKNSSSTSPRAAETITDRLSWLLQNQFGGRQKEMSERLGVEQSTLSRVLAGRRRPSYEILAAVAGLPEVNAKWLLLGRGEPMLRAADMAVDCAVPIARQLLLGYPGECPEQLTGEYVGIARHLFGPQRYFLELGADSPIVLAKSEALLAGDLLLLDRDMQHFLGKLALDPGLYAVQEKGGLRLARVARDRDDNVTALVYCVDGKGKLVRERFELVVRGRPIPGIDAYWWKGVFAKAVLVLRRKA